MNRSYRNNNNKNKKWNNKNNINLKNLGKKIKNKTLAECDGCEKSIFDGAT